MSAPTQLTRDEELASVSSRTLVDSLLGIDLSDACHIPKSSLAWRAWRWHAATWGTALTQPIVSTCRCRLRDVLPSANGMQSNSRRPTSYGVRQLAQETLGYLHDRPGEHYKNSYAQTVTL